MTLTAPQPPPLMKRGPAEEENYEFHWSGPFLEAHLLSDVGKKRKRNEDSCALCVPDDPALLESRGMFFAVADGMGGASAGDFASRLCLDSLADRYYHDPAGPISARLCAALEGANLRIFNEAEADPDRHGMGTTVSAAIIHGDCAYIIQVGDSRVYVLRKREAIFQITDDHSLVAEQVRNGYISAEQARSHSLKNLITRAVGIKESVKIDLFGFRLQQDDTILICSDGLSNCVRDQEIAEVLAMDNLQGAARILVGRALTEGGSDNITTVLFRVTGIPPGREFDAGVEEVFIPKPGILRRVKRLLQGRA